MVMKNIVQYLEETTKGLGNKTAIVDEHGCLTFNQLREQSKKLASKLINKNIFKSGVIVFLPKSKECIVGFISVAYSGNFYTPLDVDMPMSRINKIIKTLKPSAVITNSEYSNIIEKSDFDGEYLYIDKLEEYPINESSIEKTLEKTIDTDLLYVLFTSGSTGDPKGVSITHRSVIDYTEWVGKTFNLTSEDVLGNQAPFYFDNSVLDIYGMLRNGATMHIIPHELFSYPALLLNYLNENNVTTIFWVPSALILVANLKAFEEVKLETLKKILFAGEVMPNKQLNIWRKYNPNALYANLYGPTECSVDCTYYIVDREFNDQDPLPIGFPCENTDIIVLNDKDEEVKNGETGELCVRGSSLSCGYYGNPEKTKEAFVQNPLNPYYPEIIYRTGDLVKYNEYGELLYLGRKDFQIKHKGHRIELGEIESAANSLEYISTCCCLYDEKRSKIVMIIEDNIDSSLLKKDLENLIPEYMVPAKYIKIDKIPLNANGKIHRTLLKNEYIK